MIKLKIRNPWGEKYYFVLITKIEADLMMNAYRKTGNRYFVASSFPSEYMDALVSFINENKKN